ncbi:hypothetical protein G6F55_006859 [Rhizopus delemar]|nr:hypothetical protein G6F55_006859 [Rhizopus delemar]KAG1538656.1 hypothetical protein G6F51_009638 [Rhizopus arrhizus]KAG1493421.1 hypothetical protein G6F54_008590 [Rhizopus delemar]KAG1509397.1 hypothetical protein G6F53_007476 [Rhizopus delemar]KAG1515294.1 hypothetical protein G6F52_009717 [Rhizopus delemar]
MLENPVFKETVSWDSSGTSFLIKDINDFTKIILPQHFKHCNFASFVRQLNKYDFHKIRNNKQDQVWQFKHEYFKKDRKDLLEEIKRKTTVKQKEEVVKEESTVTNEGNDMIKDLRHLIRRLQTQVQQMKQSQQDLELTVEKMHKRDQAITSEIEIFQQNLMKKDELLKQCIQLVTTTNNHNNTTKIPTHNNNSLTHALDKLQQQQQYLATNKEKNKTIIAANWTTPPRVLLVDDDSVYRDICGRMLDIVMPNMDGITTTRNIRRFDGVTPVVSMTSNFTQNDIMDYINIGMNDILPKPFSKNTLYDILEKHCARLKLPTNYTTVTTPTTTPTPLLIEEASTSSTTTSPTTTPTHHNTNAIDYLTLNQHRKRPKFFHNPSF